MAKVLFINPNKWGRGITHLWITTHSSILKKENHEVELFDCTFYSKWTDDEVGYATQNEMFKPSDYKDFVSFTKNSITNDLQNKINDFKPDITKLSATIPCPQNAASPCTKIPMTDILSFPL